MSGKNDTRSSKVIASKRSLPLLINGDADGIVAKLISISPLAVATELCAPPLNGTCMIFTFAIRLNSSPAKCCAPPVLAEP
ncbi:hypothetical protein D3C83_159310 [compost metagenome]